MTESRGGPDAEALEKGIEIDITQIMQLLPHRYPMLLVDKLVEVVPSQSAVGIKNVTINEPFFQGHFPGHPVMPGVLIVEAMAQTAGALVVYSQSLPTENQVVYFMTIDKARFRRPVLPGDSLRIKVEVQRNRGPVWRFAGTALVDGTVVAEAEFSAMMVNTAETSGDAQGGK